MLDELRVQLKLSMSWDYLIPFTTSALLAKNVSNFGVFCYGHLFIVAIYSL